MQIYIYLYMYIYMYIFINSNIQIKHHSQSPVCIYIYIYIHRYMHIYICIYLQIYVYIYIYIYIWISKIKKISILQSIEDRVPYNLEIISKNFQFSIKRASIVMGFIIGTIYYVVLIVNLMGSILDCWKSFMHKL